MILYKIYNKFKLYIFFQILFYKMLEIRILLIIILLGLSLYYIYKMYSFNSHIISKSAENIIDNMDDKFDEVDEKFSEIDNKLQSIEDLINVRLEICYKKVNDIYSLQNKVNEITKMNNQSIIHQINQYDEEIEDVDINKHGNMYNSLETSMSPQSKTDKLNNKCFIKHTNAKNQDREMFYMSSINKNELHSKEKNLSETSTEPEPIKPILNYKNNIVSSNTTSTTSNSSNKIRSVKSNTKSSENSKLSKPSKSSKSSKSTNTKLHVNTSDKNNNGDVNTDNNIFKNLYKNNKKSNLRIVKDNISLENESNLEEFINSLPDNIVDNFFQKNKDTNTTSSVILEMNSDIVKSCEVETTSPKFANAMKILNETNVIKNNSYNKLNELNKKTKNLLSSKNTNNDNTNGSTSDNTDDNTKSNPEDTTEHITTSDSLSGNILENDSFVFAEFPIKKNKIVELN